MRRERLEPVIIPRPSDAELIKAVEFDNINQAETLLKQSANPNAVDDYIGSALGIAVFNGNIKLVKLLVSYGANVNIRDHDGITPLDEAAFASLKTAQKISRFLLDHGANVNAVNSRGWTPLMNAVNSKRNVDLVKLLLERGADATLRNSDGKKALDMVGRNKHTAALKAILEPVS